MPVHDWTRIYSGVFHHLHVTWLVELARTLNHGLFPPGYYALGEQVIGGAVPDVLTLGQQPAADRPAAGRASVEARPGRLPAASITAVAETPSYPPRPLDLPPGRPLQVISYLSEGKVSSFIEPLAVGDVLPEAPLFLDDGLFVGLPLEATYMAAFAALPAHLRETMEGR